MQLNQPWTEPRLFEGIRHGVALRTILFLCKSINYFLYTVDDTKERK
jgi:hypothetical protein